MEDRRKPARTRASKRDIWHRDIDPDDAPSRPSLGHGQGKTARATADIEQVAFRREVGEVEQRRGKPARPTPEKDLVSRAVVGMIARFGCRRIHPTLYSDVVFGRIYRLSSAN